MNLSSTRKPVDPPLQSPQRGKPKRVLLLGATGFIGSRVLRALESQNDTPISILSRGHDKAVGSCDNTVIRGDITDPAALHYAMDGIDVVINAASYVGQNADLARSVNLEGTRNVVRACQALTISRLIQISTTSVYGSGPHRAPDAWEIDYKPESVASQTRATAERAVLAAGGIVIRPSLIRGVGDRWFIPGIIRMFQTLNATIEGGDARISTIDVEDLGSLIAAISQTSVHASGALHAADPDPVSIREVLRRISGQIQELNLQRDCSLGEALRLLRPSEFRPHQVRMVAQDHYYESARLWTITAHTPKQFDISPEAASWYRTHLSQV